MDELWTTTQKAMAYIAQMYPFGQDHDDAVAEATLEVATAAKAGKVGGDIVWQAVRPTMQRYGRNGWNHVDSLDLMDPDILDGMFAAVDHYRDGNILLEELAIAEMMKAVDSGDTERAEEIQHALWEWETWLPGFDPTPQTIFDPQPDVSLELRILDAYDDPEIAEAARLASTTNAGYDSEDRDIEHSYLLQEALHIEEDSSDPAWRAPRVNGERLGRAIQRHARGLYWLAESPLKRWAMFVMHSKRITHLLTDLEKYRLSEWIRNWDKCPMIASHVADALIQIWDIDMFDDDIDWDMEYADIPDDEEVPEITGTGADIDAFLNIICPPAEHPKWKPWHDKVWIENGGALTTRSDFQTCKDAGKRAFGKQRSELNKRHRLGPMVLKTTNKQGVSNANGRSISWEQVREMGIWAPQVVKGLDDEAKRDYLQA